MLELRLPARVFQAFFLQRFPPVPVMQPEEVPAVRRVFRRAPAACPAAPAVRLHLPKVLRVFFRHDKRLHGEISRIVYGLVRDFTTAAAGSSIRTAAVVVFQSS
jgi:hypothetical protein